MPTPTEDDIKHAHQRAWDWFALHSNQRMQTFNYFLVATVFLAGAYGSMLEKNAGAAAFAALAGAWISLWFRRMDVRTRQLIESSRAPLIKLQDKLAELTEIEELRMSINVAINWKGASTYSRVIDVTQGTVGISFLAAAIYAAYLALKPHL